jgi:cell cycle checkpoint protein
MCATQGTYDDQPPIFKAVSNSARQLFQLLNCIRFVPKVHVTISNEGLRFAVEDARVLQGKTIRNQLTNPPFGC